MNFYALRIVQFSPDIPAHDEYHLTGVGYCKVYIDDILIASENPQ